MHPGAQIMLPSLVLTFTLHLHKSTAIISVQQHCGWERMLIFSSLICGTLLVLLAAALCIAMPHQARVPAADGSALKWTNAQGLEGSSC